MLNILWTFIYLYSEKKTFIDSLKLSQTKEDDLFSLYFLNFIINSAINDVNYVPDLICEKII